MSTSATTAFQASHIETKFVFLSVNTVYSIPWYSTRQMVKNQENVDTNNVCTSMKAVPTPAFFFSTPIFVFLAAEKGKES